MAQARLPVTTVASRADLGSCRYWIESPERHAQRFYILICLALSSIHDHFFGVEERRRGNHNWSATISYYSIVHAARSLVFQALGSFPTGHSQLGSLLSGRFTGQLDWLQRFDRTLPNAERPADTRAILATHLRDALGLRTADNDVARLAEILQHAKKLRNECNYEALLIAHQRHHVIVADAVEQLAADMEQAADEVGSLLARTLVAEVQRGPDIPEDQRPTYRALAHDYLQFGWQHRIEPGLQASDVRQQLRAYMDTITFDGPRADYDVLERAISLPGRDGLFDTKQGLMKRYQDDIQEFGRVLQRGGAAAVNVEGEV